MRRTWLFGAAAVVCAVSIFGHAEPISHAQTRQTPANVNWALHNLDLPGTRYSPMDQINRSNVKTLVPRWLFQHGVIDGVSNQSTPSIVDGMMLPGKGSCWKRVVLPLCCLRVKGL